MVCHARNINNFIKYLQTVVYWPPKDHSKKIKTYEIPDKQNWRRWDVRILGDEGKL